MQKYFGLVEISIYAERRFFKRISRGDGEMAESEAGIKFATISSFLCSRQFLAGEY